MVTKSKKQQNLVSKAVVQSVGAGRSGFLYTVFMLQLHNLCVCVCVSVHVRAHVKFSQGVIQLEGRSGPGGSAEGGGDHDPGLLP